MQAKDKITKAKAGLVLDEPFFASIALRLLIKEDGTCKTAWTDGVSLGYNPEFIESLTLDETKGLIAHEVMHIAALHHVRRQDRDHETWNAAADYAINYLLTNSKFTLPKGALQGFPNEAAEAIYSKLPKPEKQSGGSGSGSNKSKDGSSNSDPGGCGEVRDAPGQDGQKPSEADISKAEAEAKVMIAQASQQAKMCGKLPAHIARLVEDTLEPVLDWKELLRRFVDQNAKNDYAWMPPNKRYIHMGLFMPSLRSQELKNIAVAIDTSGSINQEVLKEFVSELGAIMEAYDSNAYVMYVNNALQGVEEFTAYDIPLKLNAQGGGGTDFRPPFNHLEEKGMLPSCFIYLTDGQCSSFSNDPNYPVLWCIIGSAERFHPPFGEVIQIK